MLYYEKIEVFKGIDINNYEVLDTWFSDNFMAVNTGSIVLCA